MILRAPMTHFRYFILMVAVACGKGLSVDPGSGSDYTGSGSDAGSDTGSDGSGGDDGDANVPPTYPTQHPRIYLGQKANALKAALATPAGVRFKSTADTWVAGGDVYNFSPWNAALLGALTSDPKYCTKAIAAVDAQVSAGEAASSGGTQPEVANDSYLHVGDLIGDLALTYDWCFATVTASQKSRWLAYANQAVWNVWHPDQAMWGGHAMPWTGWSINDPSDNYYYSFLRATMLLGLAEKGEDPHGDDWITQFRQTKVLGQLIPTFDHDLDGGGSREGTGYGVAMRNLWSLYDFWHATTGEGIGAKTAHTRASMLSFIHQVVPTLDRFAPTGDQSRDSTASMFDYQRNYLQELVALYPKDKLAPRASALLAACSVPQMASGFMVVDDFMYANADVTATTLDGLGTAYHAAGIGELYARSGWDTHATWINLIAGPYTEYHAHQDQGSLMIYKDGWLSYDAVIDSHSGLRQETAAHSLVRVSSGGQAVTQVVGSMSSLAALHAGQDWLYASADVTPAYGANSPISKMQREIVFLKPSTIVVYDRVTSAAGTTQTWQLATPKAPAISGSTATITGTHALHVQRLAPAGATSSAFSYTSDPSGDYGAGYRLDETIAGGDQRFLHVLSIDNAVTSASASGDSTVTVSLAGGQTATIAFSHDTVGATLTYGGTTTTLAPGVDNLPE